MKKISVLLIGVVAFFITGCAEDTTISSDDIYVSSFYDMGCNDNFESLIMLGKNPSVSGTYPNAIVYDLSCNSDTHVTVEIFDFNYAGHYAYFLVNGANPSYSNTISRGGTHSYTFQFNTNLPYEYGNYDALVRITALNLETRKWTYREPIIYGLENDINSRSVAAKSMFESRIAPKMSVDINKKDAGIILKEGSTMNDNNTEKENSAAQESTK